MDVRQLYLLYYLHSKYAYIYIYLLTTVASFPLVFVIVAVVVVSALHASFSPGREG